MAQKSPHNFPESIPLLDILKTKLATIYFYENIVVFEANEGVTISYDTSIQMLIKGVQIMKTRPFFYIANRINSYAVNPTDFKYLEAVPTLKGIAMVHYSEQSKINAEYESKFFNKPLGSFDSLEDAYNWGKKVLETVTK